MKVLMLQNSGDYREDFIRLMSGGDEYYYGQRASVLAVSELREFANEIAMFCGCTNDKYNELISPGLRAIGGGFHRTFEPLSTIRFINEYNPSHLIIGELHPLILSWAFLHKIPSIIMTASSFRRGGPRTSARNRLNISLINLGFFDWFGAYGLTAALDYQRRGIKSNKIIPWDFISREIPSFFPKELRTGEPPWKLLFVGSLKESKGVGDIIDAIAYLKSSGISVHLKVVGSDEGKYWEHRASKLNIIDQVEFHGLIPNKYLVTVMRECDAILVPSWHQYPEGFPLVIVQALESCSPIIASDHPMFRRYLLDEKTAIVFPAADYKALANAIKRLLSNAEIYRKISSNSEKTWRQLNLPVKHRDLLHKWMSGTISDRNWLANHSIASGIYSSLK